MAESLSLVRMDGDWIRLALGRVWDAWSAFGRLVLCRGIRAGVLVIVTGLLLCRKHFNWISELNNLVKPLLYFNKL